MDSRSNNAGTANDDSFRCLVGLGHGGLHKRLLNDVKCDRIEMQIGDHQEDVSFEADICMRL